MGQASTEHILSIMATVNEVKDDLREVRSHQDRQTIRMTDMGESLDAVKKDVSDMKAGPMYSVEKYLHKQVFRLGGIGGVLMLLIALTGWSL